MIIPYFMAYPIHYFMNQKLGATAKNGLQIQNIAISKNT